MSDGVEECLFICSDFQGFFFSKVIIILLDKITDNEYTYTGSVIRLTLQSQNATLKSQPCYPLYALEKKALHTYQPFHTYCNKHRHVRSHPQVRRVRDVADGGLAAALAQPHKRLQGACLALPHRPLVQGSHTHGLRALLGAATALFPGARVQERVPGERIRVCVLAFVVGQCDGPVGYGWSMMGEQG